MTAQTDIRHAPLALWRIAQAFLNLLHNLFGAPSDIARAPIMAREAHRRLASWLACAEAMLRRLLLIEAAALTLAPARACVSAGKVRIRRAHEFWPDKPEEWRVSFQCFSSKVGARRLRPRISVANAPAPPEASRSNLPRFRDAWPLALRYEALIRAFNEPHAYARRLARSLTAKPRRISQLLHAPHDYAHRVDQAHDLTREAAGAWERRNDTS